MKHVGRASPWKGAFEGPLYFLSNFYPLPVKMPDGMVYPTAEHAYQAYKTLEGTERRWIAESHGPGLAKRRGRQVSLRPGWEGMKEDVMRKVLYRKFRAGTEIAHKLLHTGTMDLVETNNWHDIEWGVCECGGPGRCARKQGARGKNKLGRILEEVRAYLVRKGAA